MTIGSPHAIINVTPLIDILLVLMMIMMVITPITSRGLPAAVPNASIDGTPPPAQQPLVVRIDLDSNLWLNREPVPEREFDSRITYLLARRSGAVLFIEGDKDLAFSSVSKLVDRVRGLGVSTIALMPTNNPPSSNQPRTP